MPEAKNSNFCPWWVRRFYNGRAALAGLSYGLFAIWSFYLLSTDRNWGFEPTPMLIGVLGYDGHLRSLWDQLGSDAPYFGGWRYTAEASLCLMLIIVSQWIHAKASVRRMKWIAAGSFAIPASLLLMPLIAAALHNADMLKGIFYSNDVPLSHYGHLITWSPHPTPIFAGFFTIWSVATLAIASPYRPKDGWLTAVRRAIWLMIIAVSLFALTEYVRKSSGDIGLPGLQSMWVLSAAAAIWAGGTLTTLLFQPPAHHLCMDSHEYERLPPSWSRWLWKYDPSFLQKLITRSTNSSLILSSLCVAIILFLVGCIVTNIFIYRFAEYLILGMSGTRGRGFQGPVIPLLTPTIALVGLWSGILACMKYYRQRWHFWNQHSLYCVGCWYDLRGSVAANQQQCPECGEQIPGVKYASITAFLETKPVTSPTSSSPPASQATPPARSSSITE